MNAIIIVHTYIYIYGSIHIGFVIINFWQVECAVLICIYVIVLYVLQLIHILNNVILFTFLREKNVNFVSLFLTRDLLLFLFTKQNTIVQSGTSIVLYKIICTFLSRSKLETPRQMIHIQNSAQILSGLYTAVENNPIRRTYAIISHIGT